jgi:hypothetical protein
MGSERNADAPGVGDFSGTMERDAKNVRRSHYPKDISFDEAEATLGAVVSFLETQQIVPFSFPLPE